MAPSLRHPLGRLRLAGLIEGTTLVSLICIAVPLKHLGGIPEATTVVGPIHGVAFILYLVTLVDNFVGGGWTLRDMVRTSIVAIIPLGTFINDRWLARRSEGT